MTINPLTNPSLGYPLDPSWTGTTNTWIAAPISAPSYTCNIANPPTNADSSDRLIPLCSLSSTLNTAYFTCTTTKATGSKQRDNCIDFCNAAADGTILKELERCWEQKCDEGEFYAMGNKETLEYLVELNQDLICMQYGLTGNETKSEGSGAVIEGEDEKPKGNGTAAPVKQDEEDSAAGVVGVGKGALVLALVFGSLFSGLMM